LQADLAERELDLATLRAELNAFELLYLRTLGLRYAELDGLEAEIAEFLAAAAPHNGKARRRAAQARAQAQDSEEATEWVGEPSGEEQRFVPSEDLKKLYRRVAKRVHPDLTDDDDERELRQELMAEANQAYAEGDVDRLKDILDDWERTCSPAEAETTADLELERTHRRIDQALARLRAIAAELEELKSSELYQLHLKVESGKRLGADLLAEMSRTVDRQIAAARRRLRALKTGADPWIEEFFAAAERAEAEGPGEGESPATPPESGSPGKAG
jgi:hypothetical protein